MRSPWGQERGVRRFLCRSASGRLFFGTIAGLACLGRPVFSETLEQRFLREAPLQWEDYLRRCDGLDGRVSFVFKVDGQLDNQSWSERKHNDRCRLVLHQELVPTPSYGDLCAYNDHYAFRLRRAGTDGGWALVGVPAARDAKYQRPTRERDMTPQVLANAYPAQLPGLIRRSTFRVRQAKDVALNGRRVIQIEFECPEKAPSVEGAVRSGTLWLDPERSWCLCQSQVHCVYPGNVSEALTQVEFRDDAATFPIPRRVVIKTDQMREAEGRIKTIGEFDCELREPGSLPPDEDFTLTAFGLPEPEFISSRPTPTRWWLWGSLAGGALLALGAIFGWLRQRAQCRNT